MMLLWLWLWLWWTTCCEALTVKVLTQRRVEGLRRVLASLERPYEGRVDVEIHVDQVEPEEKLLSFLRQRRSSKVARQERKEVIAVAKEWCGRWAFGCRVIKAPEWRGVRGQWLACSDPSVFGEELSRFLIVEDDVELSPAWYEFLRKARTLKRTAGVSLQRQRYKLDEYDDSGKLSRLKVRDEVYLFSHVGPWAFSPEPRVWLGFLEWYRNLKDPDSPSAWSSGVDGRPLSRARKEEEESSSYRENLIARWYRESLLSTRGDAVRVMRPEAMWTAHFDAYIAKRGLRVVHAAVDGNRKAFATSYRSDGEHYVSINAPDAALASMDDFERVDFQSIRSLGVDGRSLLLLDASWYEEVGETALGVQGLGFGYAPLAAYTRAQALCVLEGKKVAVLGDSIARYFAFTLNYFLNTGEIPPEWDVENDDLKWAYGVQTDANAWVGGDYYDTGTTWDGATDRSDSDIHTQKIDAFIEGVSTTFWFIQDTWYEGMLSLNSSDYDVVVANSGWWELKDSAEDGTACESEGPFYANQACLDGFEADLANFAELMLKNRSVAIWRATSCCGGTFSDASEVEKGAISVAAMNVVAERVMFERGIEFLDVEHLLSPQNIGDDASDVQPNDRTVDGGHPRAYVQWIWVQLVLNKVARSLGRLDDCGDGTPAPSFSSTCLNGVLDPTTEADVDCGGTCETPCGLGASCVEASDCATLFCVDGACSAQPPPDDDDDDDGDDGESSSSSSSSSCDEAYGDCDSNVRDLGTFVRGNETLTCVVSDSDGVRYDEAPLDARCPTPGQRMLLALLVACVGAFLRRRKSSALHREQQQQQQQVEETKNCDLEDELSREAIQVLQDMERREKKHAAAAVAAESSFITTTTTATAFAEEEEEEEEDNHPQQPPTTKRPRREKEGLRWCFVLSFVLGTCVLGEWMPAGYLPAGSRVLTENPDLWIFIMLCTAALALKHDPGDQIFLSRAQANEFKGWMQVAFVAYHYTNAQDLYVPVRWFVSAYVWLTGFGNGVYFWESGNFTSKRFAQQLWRINFLCLLLSLATGTPWIDYYFVALATVHYVIIFLALGIASHFPPHEKKIGLVLALAIVVALWGEGHPDHFGSGSVFYRLLFQRWLRKISTHTENYFWTRTKMDYLSAFHGLVCAAFYPKFRDAWPTLRKPIKAAVSAAAFALLGVAIFVATRARYCCRDGLEYRRVHAYVGTLWIPAYLVARNATPYVASRVATPLAWIGAHSLEFYLLQFHVFLTRKSRLVLYVIPKENFAYTNMLIVGTIYVFIVITALKVTTRLRAVAWQATSLQVLTSAVWLVGFYAIFAVFFPTTCSPRSWATWAAFLLIALAAFTSWGTG
ncbi:hypothetical protein CTAYLR_001642 [Chrysophaeum taylorii]|uniref:Cas1p 10 TM acyl transferase domain-containing protein n=1 Tax=Chrysophaeum taylorii TaxID=2483200 RepID=A0AAD7UCM9_9STRA|nr:hypothetical protein CTAYLR_001642 [Chrysophaeum taylorii]